MKHLRVKNNNVKKYWEEIGYIDPDYGYAVNRYLDFVGLLLSCSANDLAILSPSTDSSHLCFEGRNLESFFGNDFQQKILSENLCLRGVDFGQVSKILLSDGRTAIADYNGETYRVYMRNNTISKNDKSHLLFLCIYIFLLSLLIFTFLYKILLPTGGL